MGGSWWGHMHCDLQPYYKDIKQEIVHTLLLEEYGVSKKWGWLRLALSLTEGRRWDKRHMQRSTAGSWLYWLEYVIRTSMNTWIISSIITNHRTSDRYSEHSKREYHEPHKDSCDWQDWGLTLEALPPRGGGSAGCPKKGKRRARGGSREQNTQINLNK